MQRWIVIAVVVAFLGAVAGGFCLWTYRQNKPQRVWVPVGLNPDLPEDKREQLAEQIKAKLLEGSIILDAVKDVGLAPQLDLPTSEAAEAEVKKRLFVEIGETVTQQGATVPSLNVGVNAQRKTFAAMGKVSTRLMKDVWKILGIKEPEPAPF
jgi:O-methyltransferase involved in polyketide biosynthesis